jgi:hypothetical protein
MTAVSISAMLTDHSPARGFARVLLPLGMLITAHLSLGSSVQAQERRYLFEAGAAGALQSYNNDTGLDGSFGGLGRLGLWLPLNFSVEVEGSLAKPNGIGVKVGFPAV